MHLFVAGIRAARKSPRNADGRLSLSTSNFCKVAEHCVSLQLPQASEQMDLVAIGGPFRPARERGPLTFAGLFIRVL